MISESSFRAPWKALLAGGIAAAVVLAPATVATAAPSDPAEGLARILATDLLQNDLAVIGTAASGSESNPGPVRSEINAELLSELLSVSLPEINLPLISSPEAPGLLDLGDDAALGLLNAFSASASDTESIASAGVVDDDGAINTTAVTNPGTIGSTKLELTALLYQLGVAGITDTVVDALRVEIGALASRAAQTDGGAIDRQYGLAGARLVVHSPALDAIAGTLRTAVGAVGTSVNNLTGPDGALASALNAFRINVGPIPLVGGVTGGPASAELAVDLAGVVDAVLAEPLTSEGGLVTIDLSTGTIIVDVAKLLKGDDGADLNGLAPNTEVLDGTTIAAIGAGIAQALDLLGEAVGDAVDAAVYGTSLTIAIPLTVTLLGSTLDLTTSVTSTLGGLVGLPGTTPPAINLPRRDPERSRGVGDPRHPHPARHRRHDARHGHRCRNRDPRRHRQHVGGHRSDHP